MTQSSSVSLDQWAFTSRWEGVVPHMYLDTAGIVTCGVGFALRDETAVALLPWTPDVLTAIDDFRILSVKPSGLPAALYKRHCRAELSGAAIREVFELKIADVRRRLEAHWQLSMQPVPVQLALVDMAYNLGVAGLTKFERLHDAVQSRDWITAANECSRRGIQAPRNEATIELFLVASTEES
jgi:GH24 family phage-related lysozyme (muramidase)